MASSSTSSIRLPRPKTFLGLMSLQTGVEMISLAMLFNKLTGLYGVLAIFTGYELSPFQLSMYIYSIAVLVLLAVCMSHIRRQTPLPILGLAWLYIVDTAVNTAYTTAFAISWFMTSGQSEAAETDGAEQGPSFSGTIDTTLSLVLIVAFTLIRVWFIFVVMAFASSVLQQHMHAKQQGWNDEQIRNADSPFAPELPDGEGWKGKVGRVLVVVGKEYWLGQREEDEWTRDMNTKFQRGSTAS